MLTSISQPVALLPHPNQFPKSQSRSQPPLSESSCGSLLICFLICKMRDWTRCYLIFFRFWLLSTHFPMPVVRLPPSAGATAAPNWEAQVSSDPHIVVLPAAWVPGPDLHLLLSLPKRMLHHLARLRERVLGVHLGFYPLCADTSLENMLCREAVGRAVQED